MAGFWMGLIVFFFGTCIGSFLNVIVYRLNHDLSPFRGRSFCPKCKKKILWQDNLPLVSFVLLKGKCRFCYSPISWQYPLVELFTGLATVFVVYYLPIDFWVTIYSLLITYILITIFVSDWRYQTIPDEVVYSGIGLVIVFLFWSSAFLGTHFLAGLGSAGFFGLLVWITRGKGMGLGDVKFAGLMGLILGFPGIVVALMLAFLTGALAGVILVLGGKKRFGEHIPFGPFLTGATWISLFWGQIIWQIYLEKLLL